MFVKQLTINDLNKSQRYKHDQFANKHHDKNIVIEWHRGDFRDAYRYYQADCRTHVAASLIGYSNGCTVSHGNYHSTWAIAYNQQKGTEQ